MPRKNPRANKNCVVCGKRNNPREGRALTCSRECAAIAKQQFLPEEEDFTPMIYGRKSPKFIDGETFY